MTRTIKQWTPEEDEYIRTHYATESTGNIAATLGRTYRAVTQRASWMRRSGIAIPAYPKAAPPAKRPTIIMDYPPAAQRVPNERNELIVRFLQSAVEQGLTISIPQLGIVINANNGH